MYSPNLYIKFAFSRCLCVIIIWDKKRREVKYSFIVGFIALEAVLVLETSVDGSVRTVKTTSSVFDGSSAW